MTSPATEGDQIKAPRKMVIYGGGPFAKLMRHLFERDMAYVVVAYCLDRDFITSCEIEGVPIVPFDEVENLFPPQEFDMFVAIGYSNMRNRVLMYEKAKQKKYVLANYVSSNSVVSDSAIVGENNVFFQGVQIEPFVNIGDNNVFWSSVNICHDVIIASHSFIAAKSIVGGFSEIGDNCFLGFNSTIIQNIKVADESLIGACALVISNTREYSKNIGIPAKETGRHIDDGIKIK